ncbi:MAG: sigma-70 family RNA polymerase sigma factor [Chloroflexi bacterium]|nr:sigma-70 family RNA polymerase sigma factor [Chloroflexota bacterium]
MEKLTGLVIASRAGDCDAYEKVVRRFQDMAVAYAYAQLGDWQEAEDAAQEAFIAAWYGLLGLRNAAAFPGWFRRIVHSRANRRLRLRQPLLVSLEQVGEIAAADPAPDSEGLPDDIVATIEALPEAQRSVLLLHYMNDFAQAEIAAFLEIPLGTVKSRLYHARKQIKQRMTALDNLSAQRPSRDSQFTEKVMRLFDAAKSGDIDKVRALLAEDGRLANAEGFVRTSLWGSDAKALHVAVMHGRKDIVDLLLAHGADINARDDKYHFNALIHAIDLADFMPAYADLGMVDFLLERGAEMDVWACAWLGDMEGVKGRLDENPALVNEIGPGPSTLMSFCRDVKGIEFYLGYGADPLVRYQRHGKTRQSSPLRDQAYRRNYPGVRRLLRHLGWAVDVFWAAIMGDIDALRALLAADGDLVSASTPDDHVLGAGMSPLHLAAQGGHLEAMELLLEAGADINAVDARGYTPLHFVICYGPKRFFDPLPDLSETTQDIGVYHLLTDVPRFLIDRGADLSARESESGKTPLELARSQFEDETDRSDVIALLEAAGNALAE